MLLTVILLVHVVITGSDVASVKRARELMEVKQESHTISSEHMAYFRRGDNNRNYDSNMTSMYHIYIVLYC